MGHDVIRDGLKAQRRNPVQQQDPHQSDAGFKKA
jgi:hypothetical protein